jgi:hypothetical protein
MSVKLHDLRSYISDMQFWSDPRLSFTIGSGLIYLITLGLIVFGVSLAVQRLGLLGWLPLLIHFTYNFSMSLARLSGWRFVLPVDWVVQLYYCIGLVALTGIVISLISNRLSTVIDNKKKEDEPANSLNTGIKIHQLLLVFFLFLGISLPLTEVLVPERYPDIGAGEMIAQYAAGGFLLENGDRITALDMKSFLETDPADVVLYGRALYPLFYEQGEFWGDDNAFSLLARNLDRLQFTYIGSEAVPVFIQLDLPPKYFPNASDVFIIGCREDAGIRALAIRVNIQASYITTSPWHGLTCPTQ